MTQSIRAGALACALLIVGCSATGNGPQLPLAHQLGMPSSTSPGSIAAAPMAHTAILSPSVMAVKPQGEVQDASYTQLPGTGSYAAAAPDGSLWVLSDQPSGPDKFIWHYADGTWTNISGEASQIAVGSDGTLYAINSGGGTYAYSGGNWTALGGGASAIATVADGSFYVLSNGNSPGSDQAIWHNVGGTWTQVPGEGVSIAGNFDTGSYAESGGTVRAGGLYIVNSLGAIYYENTDDSFVQLPSNASALAPTTVGGVYALGYPSNANGNNLYYYDLDAQTWSVQSGAGVSISSGDGTLYVIASTGAIYSTPIAAAGAAPGTTTEYSVPTADAELSDITAGADGNLWFSELDAAKIGKITPGGVITEYAIPSGDYGALTPSGVTAGPDGNIWFVAHSSDGSSAPGYVANMTPTGNVTEYLIQHSDLTGSIVTGSDGNLWFTEGVYDRIGKMTTGGVLTEYTIPTSNGYPGDIVAGPDGNLWFTEYSANQIGKITTGGVISEYPIPTADAGPSGITVGPDGNLWFTESIANQIGRITTGGTVTAEYPLSAACGCTGPSPDGIVTGPEGNLWFTEDAGNRIGKMTTTGSFVEYPTPTLNAEPGAITAGPDGNLWFTELRGKIGKIVP